MKALIIGGGIAGTVTAIGLRKAGIDAELYEAYPRGSDGVGAYLTLATNGLQALAAVDVDGERLGGFATPSMTLRLGNGTALTELDLGHSRTITRADLYGGLRDEAARRGVVTTYGKRIVDAKAEGDVVTARFDDGSTATGDVLIGADGLRSRVRALVDARAPAPRFLGLLNAGGYAHGVNVDAPSGAMQLVFGRRGFFGYVRHPDGDVWWFANPARDREPTAEELAAVTDEAWRRELVDLFRDDASPAVALIEASPKIFAGWPTYDFPSLPTWHRDRMIVVGDAAHAASPSSGQGASMAIEDGVVLAQCLRDESSATAAFTAYEAQRRARVERVVREGKGSGDGKAPGPVGRVFRDLALRLVFAAQKRRPDPRGWILQTPVTWSEARS